MKKVRRENSKVSPVGQNGRIMGSMPTKIIRGKEEVNGPRKPKE